MQLVWTRDGKLYTDTIHRAGCNHARTLSREIVDTLRATSVATAMVEMWETFGIGPEDLDDQFQINVAACAR